MYAKFLSLPMEKKNRIINSSLCEFSDNGFDKSSTNEIVHSANISKGLLFHYFKSKKGLFLFLYDYCIDICLNDIYKKINMNEKDFFLRISDLTHIKLELLHKYPEMFKFIQVAYMDTSDTIKLELVERNIKLTQSSMTRIFDDVDSSKFKEGLNLQKAQNIVFYTVQGFTSNLFEVAKIQNKKCIDYEKAFKEVEDYLDILRNCLYK